jgi:hypothetical protein
MTLDLFSGFTGSVSNAVPAPTLSKETFLALSRGEPAPIADAPPGWPMLDPQALVGLAGKVVEAATANSEADPVAVLATFLTWFGATVDRKTYLAVGETEHAPQLFCVLVGASSRARKGTSGGPIKRLFKAAEKLNKDGHEVPPLVVTNGPLSSAEGLVYAVRDPGDEIDEKTGKLKDPGVEDKRLLVTEGEFAAVLKTAQREGNTLSPILRTAWDGSDIAPLTKHNRIKATGAHLCIVGHITQKELGLLLRSADVWNGFCNRFMWLCVRRNKLIACPTGMDQGRVNHLALYIASAVRRAWKSSGSVSLDASAMALWKSIYPRITEDQPGALGAITARAEAHVMRLALVYALLDESCLLEPGAALTIKEGHLQSSLAFWKYCQDSASYIFGGYDTNRDTSKILAALRDGDKTKAELNELFSGHLKSDQLSAILDELLEQGRITKGTRGGGQGKGKAATMYGLPG